VNAEASNIAWGLREVLNNRQRGNRMGKRGLERCKEFSWDVICARTEAVYRELFSAEEGVLSRVGAGREGTERRA